MDVFLLLIHVYHWRIEPVYSIPLPNATNIDPKAKMHPTLTLEEYVSFKD